MKKKYTAIGILALFLIVLAVAAGKKESVSDIEDETETEIAASTSVDEYGEALKKGADLCFWYDDASYEEYFNKLAESYFEKTGVVVQLVYQDAMDYVGEIHDATMQDGKFPDVYLLSGEELEKAHLYGVAGENQLAEEFAGTVAENAITASNCHGKMFGYPLSYNVCLLAYQSEYFENAPESLQAIIDYSNENDPPENVEYLLEWDAYDPFFGFLFVSDSVVLSDEGVGVLEASYDETLLEESMLFLEESLASFSLPLDTVTEESVLSDIVNGLTLCAVVDSDSLKELQDLSYTITEFPRLNENLDAKSAALTDMILVNDYSKKQEEAAAFAKYLTLENYDKVWELTGHYSVQLQKSEDEKEKIAYQAYENAVLAPNSQDAGGFWIDIEEMITNVIKEQL